MQDLFAKFHLFEISALATAITCFGLAALILKYRNSKLHTVWFWHNISIGAWALLVFLASRSDSPAMAYQFWIISHSIGSFVAILTFHPTCLFCNYSYPKFLKIAYVYTILDALLQLFSSATFYPNTKLLFNSFHYLQFNPLRFFLLLSLWFFLAFFSIFLLFKYAKQNKTPHGEQAKLLAILLILGYTGGCSTFLPMIGINFYPISLLLLPIETIAQTYAIF